MRRLLIPVMLLTLFAGGCSMPQTKIYSLSLPGEESVRAGECDGALAVRVRAPKYLAQPYIAYRTSPYQLEISLYSKWVASPEEMVSEAFSDRLRSAGVFSEVHASSYVSPGSYLLEINLKRFEKLDLPEASTAELMFDYAFFSPEGKEVSRGLFSRRTRLTDGGFLELARSLSAALSEGIEEVRSAIAKAMPAGR